MFVLPVLGGPTRARIAFLPWSQFFPMVVAISRRVTDLRRRDFLQAPSDRVDVVNGNPTARTYGRAFTSERWRLRADLQMKLLLALIAR
jgi:hypothetical protein